MDFDYTPKVREFLQRLLAFSDTNICSNEQRYRAEVKANRRAGNTWMATLVIEELKPQARAAGPWNLFLPRSPNRVACGRTLSEQDVWRERIAESRIMTEQARLLTLKAARMMDTVGNKVAQGEIAMIKVVAPNASTKVIDWAIQMHGGAGVSEDFPLALMYAQQRTPRFADGPDQVHRTSIAKLEIARHTTAPGGR